MVDGRLVSGEEFEKLLVFVPFITIKTPLFGITTNVFGMFFTSVLCGVLGTIIMNLIDKAISNRSKKLASENQVTKRNEILAKLNKIRIINEIQIENDKKQAS